MTALGPQAMSFDTTEVKFERLQVACESDKDFCEPSQKTSGIFPS
jgi:hypothetical protein